MTQNIRNVTKLLKNNAAAKVFINVFIFVYLPLKVSSHAFESFDPIFTQLLPNSQETVYRSVYIDVEKIALLEASAKVVGMAFFACLMIAAIITTSAFNVLYNLDNNKVHKLRKFIEISLFIKVFIAFVMMFLLSYIINPAFDFIYQSFISIYEGELGRGNVFFKAPESWLRTITPAISFITALYPMVLVVFPWERKRKIEAEVRTAISTGYDTKAINKWIGPAAEQLANDKGWTQDDVLDGIERAGGRRREDRSNVSRWYSGEKSMPADAIAFFLMHGVRKYYSSL